MSLCTCLLRSLPFLVCALVQAQTIPGSVRIIAPGVIHKEYTLPGPYTLDVVEVARNAPNIRIESYRPAGLVKTTTQAAANDRAGHRAIAAINADFFSFQTGLPVGNQVVNGGGSTTMVVGGAIVNSPSDTTGERRVANSLQVINVTPHEKPDPGEQQPANAETD